ncbi:MAG: hypothetical protein PHY93_17545 [Bacteriovorax sp.]|nr:hypothetical protein [Bacteriovorax sp.]
MMKIFTLLLFFISLNLKAQQLTGFRGCGEYTLKGILVKNTIDFKQNGIFFYKTYLHTKSEMQFVIKDSADLALISSYLNVPTIMKAHITKMMDGTRGEINHISKVSLRINNPLDQLRNSGVDLITSKNCP